MPGNTDRSALKTVERAMRVLQVFSHDRPELSVGELSRELGIHKSIVSRLVSALKRSRLLEQDPETRRVCIGVGAFRLGSIFANRQSIVQRVTPFLGMLVARTGHSAQAAVLDGTLALIVASVEGTSTLRVIARVGDHRHLHATATGKIFLAYSDASLLEAAAQDPGLVALTGTSVTELRKLRSELDQVRRSGLAWNRGESHAGTGGVAAPVLGDGRQVVAAISSMFPLGFIKERERRTLAAETASVAGMISEKFRSPSPPPRRRPERVSASKRKRGSL
jgi:DNA-binding IclR family transcriptional regulator